MEEGGFLSFNGFFSQSSWLSYLVGILLPYFNDILIQLKNNLNKVN